MSDEAERMPKQADFKRLETLSIDAALSEIEKEILAFQANGLAFRGVPPTRRVRVVADRSMSASPPQILMTDCPTVSASWMPYNLNTGRPAPVVDPKVSPPFATAASLLLLKGRWVVASATTDRTKTCVA